MNYWPAEVTNLTETHEPLFKMLTELAVKGGETARELYGAKDGLLITTQTYGGRVGL